MAPRSAGGKSGARRRDYRDEYQRRRVRRPGLTAREATGHHRIAPKPLQMSLLVDSPARFVLAEDLSRRDRSRAGRYADLVGKLDAGRIAGAEFRRRVGRWKPIAGERFLADPEAVLAILEQRRAQDVEVFVYQLRGAT